MNLFYKKNVHLIGIGGICIGGIAKILISMGCNVSGSDILENNTTLLLRSLGAKIYINHSIKNINKYIDYIICSSAIKKDNKELYIANLLKIPIISRGFFINEFIKFFKRSISISGTHGKTTTTSILISILDYNNLGPSFINGGILNNINYSSKIEKFDFIVLEADESDKSFLEINSDIIIITNIDNDHMRTYNNNLENIKKSFLKFINSKNKNGFIVLCIDNINLINIIPYIDKKIKIYTYGFNKNSDFILSNYNQINNFSYFNILDKINNINFNLKLNNSLGKHNALNASSSFITSIKLNINKNNIIKSLENFVGVKNRFNISGFYNINYYCRLFKNILFINDYGHHPTEILEVINTIKLMKYNKIIMIFQPHRYTRTYDLKYIFAEVFVNIDYLILLDIYSSNEYKNNLIEIEELFNLILVKNKNTFLCKNNNCILNILMNIIDNNDLVIFQGAGNIHNISKNILNKNMFKLVKNNFYDN